MDTKLPFTTEPVAIPNTPGVYAIKNQNSENVYIGSTADLRLRFKTWQGPCYGSWRALFPYGEPEETTFSYVVTPSVTSARDLEKQIIRALSQNPEAILLNAVLYKDLNKFVTPRTHKKLTAQGETLSITEWSKKLGIKRETIASRMSSGWAHEQCLGLAPPPPKPNQGMYHPCAKPMAAFGKTNSIDGHAREHGLNPETLRMRLKRGMPLEAALKLKTQK